MGSLPNELLTMILHRLQFRDSYTCMCCCRQFYDIINHDKKYLFAKSIINNIVLARHILKSSEKIPQMISEVNEKLSAYETYDAKIKFRSCINHNEVQFIINNQQNPPRTLGHYIIIAKDDSWFINGTKRMRNIDIIRNKLDEIFLILRADSICEIIISFLDKFLTPVFKN